MNSQPINLRQIEAEEDAQAAVAVAKQRTAPQDPGVTMRGKPAAIEASATMNGKPASIEPSATMNGKPTATEPSVTMNGKPGAIARDQA